MRSSRTCNYSKKKTWTIFNLLSFWYLVNIYSHISFWHQNCWAYQLIGFPLKPDLGKNVLCSLGISTHASTVVQHLTPRVSSSESGSNARTTQHIDITSYESIGWYWMYIWLMPSCQGPIFCKPGLLGEAVDCRGAKWKRVDGVHVLAGCSAPELNAVWRKRPSPRPWLQRYCQVAKTNRNNTGIAQSCALCVHIWRP